MSNCQARPWTPPTLEPPERLLGVRPSFAATAMIKGLPWRSWPNGSLQ